MHVLEGITRDTTVKRNASTRRAQLMTENDASGFSALSSNISMTNY
jgi:hypothetical protein